MNATTIIKHIWSTEKAQSLQDLYQFKRTQGMEAKKKNSESTKTPWTTAPKYTFVVDRHASKEQIRAALKELFPKVTVCSVNTQLVHGKVKRKMTRSPVQLSDWKKAIVTLKQGDKIDLV